jgi:hypothetical protein
MKSRTTAYVLVAACVGMGAIWFFFVSHFWSVQTIEVSGLKELGRGEVESDVYDILDHGSKRPWDQRNLFFINTNSLATKLTEKLFAESVTVEKSYPNVLRLIITERQRRVVYGVNDRLLDIDPHGFITGDEATSTAGYFFDLASSKTLADKNHATFIRQSTFVDLMATSTASSTDIMMSILSDATSTSENATATTQFVDADLVKAWLQASKTFLASNLRYRLFEVTNPTSDTLKVVTEQGYRIIFDLRQDIGVQLASYQKFLKSKPKDLNITDYIDVRIPGKIFTK